MDSKIIEQLKKNQFVIDFTVPHIHNFHHSIEDLIENFKKSKSLKELAQEYAEIVGPLYGNDGGKGLYEFWLKSESAKESIREVYEILALPPVEE